MTTLVLVDRTPESEPILEELSGMLNHLCFSARERKEEIAVFLCDKGCRQIVQLAQRADMGKWRRFLLQEYQIHPERPVRFRNKRTKEIAFEARWRS